MISGGTWRSLDMVGVEKGARKSWILALMSSSESNLNFFIHSSRIHLDLLRTESCVMC